MGKRSGTAGGCPADDRAKATSWRLDKHNSTPPSRPSPTLTSAANSGCFSMPTTLPVGGWVDGWGAQVRQPHVPLACCCLPRFRWLLPPALPAAAQLATLPHLSPPPSAPWRQTGSQSLGQAEGGGRCVCVWGGGWGGGGVRQVGGRSGGSQPGSMRRGCHQPRHRQCLTRPHVQHACPRLEVVPQQLQAGGVHVRGADGLVVSNLGGRQVWRWWGGGEEAGAVRATSTAQRLRILTAPAPRSSVNPNSAAPAYTHRQGRVLRGVGEWKGRGVGGVRCARHVPLPVLAHGAASPSCWLPLATPDRRTHAGCLCQRSALGPRAAAQTQLAGGRRAIVSGQRKGRAAVVELHATTAHDTPRTLYGPTQRDPALPWPPCL